MKKLKNESLCVAIVSIFLIIFVLSAAVENKQAKAMDSDEGGIEEVIESEIIVNKEIGDVEKVDEIVQTENTDSDASAEKKGDSKKQKDGQVKGVMTEKIEEVIEEVPAESDFETYTAKDFSFEYPKDWFINEVQSEFNSYVQIFNYDDSKVKGSHYVSKDHFKIEIVKLENPDDLSLRDWVDSFVENQDYKTEVLEERIIEVQGREAIYQIEEIAPMEIIHPAVFIKKGSSVFIMNVNQTKGYEKEFNVLLESFKFN